MYLYEIWLENFRVFGSHNDNKDLRLRFRRGLNLLAGENDSGKTAVIDGIRHVLLTMSRESHFFTKDDFHVSENARARNLTIQCVFRELTNEEAGKFFEWLSIEDNKPCLYVTLQAKMLDKGEPRSRISVDRHAGKKADGPSIEGYIQEFLRTTYLRPLRDAESELSGGRRSRLVQILEARPECNDQEKCGIDIGDPSTEPHTLVEIMRKAERLISQNDFILNTQSELNTQYLGDLSIGRDTLSSEIGIAKRAELRDILEKLELWLNPKEPSSLRTPRGLGYNNILFMSTELLLLGEDEYALPLLLIEEPEAHLHPQMQLRLMDFLEKKAGSVQTIITSHSPNLASKANLENAILMFDGKAYPLDASQTALEKSDYRYLQRFLDVTKSNLFFARGVVIVEGDAENIILPKLSDLICSSFSKHGISIVKVGSVGLFRYARIFQRKDNTGIPVRVACIADRDIVPDQATYAISDKRKKESDYSLEQVKERVQGLKKNDGGPVRTFVSPKWTLEFDLACSNLACEMHVAIQLAKKSKSKGSITEEERQKVKEEAEQAYKTWENNGLTQQEIAAKIYMPLYEKEASKAEAAQFFVENLPDEPPCMSACLRKRLPSYLVEAIDYVIGT